MANLDIDILVITYNRPEYTRLSLQQLLATCDENMRVWLWHNGDDNKTLDIVRSLVDHPRVYEFHHSLENKKLNEPTNWLWTHAKGEFLSKVDDDCLVPDGWAQKLRRAHRDVPEFGVIGCWRFLEEDFVPELANKKIRKFGGGHRVMQNCWVEGSGYLMKRACLESKGLLQPQQSFTDYCIRLAAKGWINGWYYPFLYQEHMDDPRSTHTLLRTDADMERFMPLTARNFGVNTVRDWQQWISRDAYVVQAASINPKCHLGWRPKLKRLFFKLAGKK